jgi:hypothetical protein
MHANHESVRLASSKVDGAGINQIVNRQRICREKARCFIKRQHDAGSDAPQTPFFLAQALRLHKRSFGFYPDFGSASHLNCRKWIFLMTMDNF